MLIVKALRNRGKFCSFFPQNLLIFLLKNGSNAEKNTQKTLMCFIYVSPNKKKSI